MIDRVETALDERALTPADDLASQPQLRGHRPEVEAQEPEGIEQPRIAAHEALRVVRQRRAVRVAVHDREVVQPVATDEQSRLVLEIERQLGDGLERFAECALAVVQIAVVDVRGAAAAPVRGADEPAIRVRDPPTLTVTDRGVPAAGELTRWALEADRVRLGTQAPTKAGDG